MDQTKELLMAWLARACGVEPSSVTDDHLAKWAALRAEICAYTPTAEQASGSRANGRFLGVHVERGGSEPAKAVHPDAAKFFGARPRLRGES